MEDKDSKKVLAILKKKKTYTYNNVMYIKDSPNPVDIKTARYLRNLDLFSFLKIKNGE